MVNVNFLFVPARVLVVVHTRNLLNLALQISWYVVTAKIRFGREG